MTSSILSLKYNSNEARVILWNKQRTIIICPRCSGTHESTGTTDYTNPPIYSAPSTCRSMYNSPSSPSSSLGNPGRVSTIKYPRYYEVGTGYDSNPDPYFYSPSWLEEAKLRRDLDLNIQRRIDEITRSHVMIGFQVGNPAGSHRSNAAISASGSNNGVISQTTNYLSFRPMPPLTNIEGTSRSTEAILNLDSDDPKLHLVSVERSDDDGMYSDDNDNGNRWVVRLEKGDVPIESWKVTGKGKTFAILFRGKGLLPICSESGFAHKSFSQFHPTCPTIPRNAFTRYGQERSVIEGYTLPRSPYKEDSTADWHASHAEMQLMHWFIQKNLANLVDGGADPRYQELREIQPPWRCPITILASTTPCKICNDYARHIESRYPVEIVLRA